MTKEDVLTKVLEIVKPYVKNEEALSNASDTTTFLEDLQINSARLVDIVIDFEDEFDIEVEDEEADKILAVGDAVALILEKIA
jgi:acyl carrier protein